MEQQVSQGTEHATKWNECVSPGAFAIMHKFLFDESTRLRLGLPRTNEYGRLFSKIAGMGNFLQIWKEIQLGQGVLVSNENEYSRITWENKHLEKMNEFTREWYLKVRDYITDNWKFLRSSPGMLIGMLNAASTTLGMLPANYKMDENIMRVVCMRSSDDSMTKYLSVDRQSNRDCIALNKLNLSLIGINLSPENSLREP
ncbi:unnamed protein product, partial [Brenthis ino]